MNILSGELRKFSYLRGFNYTPSYAYNYFEEWPNFEPSIWEKEVPYAKRFGANHLRIWMERDPWQADPNLFLKNVDTALNILGRNGIKMMPTLFNSWHGLDWEMGGTYLLHVADGNWKRFEPYIESFVGYFKDDPRIVIWDLANEPPVWNRERDKPWINFLAHVYEKIKEIGVNQPITIGTMSRDNIRILEPCSDVLCCHMYSYTQENIDAACDNAVQIALEYNKPLICNECCTGSFNDQERAEIARMSVDALEKRGIGWTAWHLMSGQIVTGSRERTDRNGIRGEGYMPFIMPDGSTRPGHEIFHKGSGGVTS